MQTNANRWWLVFWLMGCWPGILQAQLRFNVYSGGYFNVTDYAGYTTPDGAHQFHVTYQGQQINEPHWVVKARINGQIRPVSGQNVSGLPFPTEKLSFRFTHDNGSSPTLAEIGASTVSIPFNAAGETVLIPQSKAPISYQSQYPGSMQFNLFFAINVAGGVYLDQFKNRAAYQIIVYAVPITFTLYAQGGNVLGYQDVVYYIQVNQTLSGMPPSEPTYSIEVLGDARESKLEFGSVTNYMDGVTALYSDGLKVNASTGYSIMAKAMSPVLVSLDGAQATLPISVVNLRLQPGSNPALGGSYAEIALSDSYQVLFQAAAGQDVPQFFTISYRTAANDERLLNARSGTYTTTLLYQLLPQ